MAVTGVYRPEIILSCLERNVFDGCGHAVDKILNIERDPGSSVELDLECDGASW